MWTLLAHPVNGYKKSTMPPGDFSEEMDETPNDPQVKVLFVDDESNILRALRRLVAEENFETLIATSGEEGLEVIKANEDIGLIVSDQRMPGLTGAEFLEKAKAIAPDSLRIVLTGYADLQATMDAINKGGAYRYITKPWNDEELIQTIRDGVARYSLFMENRRLTELVNRQNEELKDWNSNLKKRVLEQTAHIGKKNEELAAANSRLHQTFDQTIKAFAGLIELRDLDVRDHSRNVADLAVAIAQELDLDKNQRQAIRTAALLHDIGKIGIDDAILLKDTDVLTARELEKYKLHAIRGQAVVDAVDDLREVGILIRHHHECYDGSGFPDRQRGKDIPLGARIIAIADHVDRISKRIRQENALEMALEKTRQQLGRLFDASLFPHLEKHAKAIYSTPDKLAKHRGMVEAELSPEQLLEGMIVLRNVVSGTGLLLLSKGAILDEAAIKSLKRYYKIDPPEHAVLVLRQL